LQLQLLAYPFAFQGTPLGRKNRGNLWKRLVFKV
jgi:hypothetical protein